MSATPDDACPIPSPAQSLDTEAVARMLACRCIVILGCSDAPDRASNRIAEYLINHGYDVVPVNPHHETVLGRRCYARLEDVPGGIDVVNVFRRSEFCADVARQAIAAGARGMWLQSGIRNEQARRLAQEAGIDYVQDRCIMVEHAMRG